MKSLARLGSNEVLLLLSVNIFRTALIGVMVPGWQTGAEFPNMVVICGTLKCRTLTGTASTGVLPVDGGSVGASNSPTRSRVSKDTEPVSVRGISSTSVNESFSFLLGLVNCFN